MINDFKLEEIDKVKYLTSDIFTNTNRVRHCFTTRMGGVSRGIYQSMNLGLSTGDDKKLVLKNYEIICNALGFDIETLVLSKQVHKDHIVRVGKESCGSGIFYPASYEDADALITNEKGVTLVAFFADCVPILLFDKEKNVLAVVHAGWRGTVLKIVLKTIQTMAHSFGSNPENILAAIGPSIHPCCYEIGSEVAQKFTEAFQDTSSILFEKGQRIFCDLQQANAEAMISEGVLAENISWSGLCTSCNEQMLYSHRASKGKRGSLAVFAELI